jgi:hypothetical protein
MKLTTQGPRAEEDDPEPSLLQPFGRSRSTTTTSEPASP